MAINAEQLEAEIDHNDREIHDICGRVETLSVRLDILGRRIMAQMKHGETDGKRIKETGDRGEIQDTE